mmetsp:Transcript_45853/g.106582  ORF Transcript_45853/g.106582 Transcript_45853/m.106582 type:complete len:129 (-) Transcript_45853:76-462(-)
MARRGSVLLAGLLLAAATTFTAQLAFVPKPGQDAPLAASLMGMGLAMQAASPAYASYTIPTPEKDATAAVKAGTVLQYGDVLYQQDDGSQSSASLNLIGFGLLISVVVLTFVGLLPQKEEEPEKPPKK